MKLDMRRFIFRLVLIVVANGVLAGCPSQQAMRESIEPSKPEIAAPVLEPMQYSWNTNYSAMLTPPLEIREKALAGCKQRGFDRAYMQSVSLNEDRATANFSCRGSDQ